VTAGSSSRLATADSLERGDEVAAADLLEQVSACAGNDRREDGLLVRIARQDHNARLGQLGTDLPARLDA